MIATAGACNLIDRQQTHYDIYCALMWTCAVLEYGTAVNSLSQRMDVCALRRVRCPMKLLDRWYDVIHEQYCYVFCQVKVQVYIHYYIHTVAMYMT